MNQTRASSPLPQPVQSLPEQGPDPGLRASSGRARAFAAATLAAALATGLVGCGDEDLAGAAPPGGGNVGFGGAQDIGQFRNILEAGDIPAANTLDAAGFFAEHYVELPPADCDETLCLQSMLSVGEDWLDGGYQATLAVAINTPVTPDSLEPKPRDLVIVVDTSGSMRDDDRIGYAREGLDLLIDELDEEDRVALVSYSSEVTVRAELTDDRDPELWRDDLHAAVAELEAAGATNLYDGLQAGFELALDGDPAREARVILLSDGKPTAGITDDQSILDMAEEYIESGVGLTTIGVGYDFNIDLMRGLSERGAGNFYFLEDAEAIREVFTEELDYFVSPLALDVTVEVRADGGYRLGEVVGTRLWKTEGGVGSMHLPAVFLASRTTTDPSDDYGRRGGGGTLFIEMDPTGGFGADPGHVAEVRLRYREPDGETYAEQIIEVRNPADPGVSPEDAYYSHQAMAKQYAMYNFYLGLREASITSEYDYHCALSLLEDLDAEAEAWNLEYEDDDIAADRQLVTMFAGNLRERGAYEVPEEQACTGYYYDDPYDDPYYGEPVDEEVSYYGCSAAGAPNGAGLGLVLLWLGALALGVRRRRSGR